MRLLAVHRPTKEKRIKISIWKEQYAFKIMKIFEFNKQAGKEKSSLLLKSSILTSLAGHRF